MTSKAYLSQFGKLVDFKKVLSVCRSRGIFCQIIVQSISQLSDRYEKKEWEELIGNADVQICLGCNDEMTAEYISDKCGQITIRVNNNQFPLMPLFSPVYTSTRPYSQTKSNTQRALMQPDEILRMDNRQCLVLLRGQKPMLLYKIIPEEFPLFQKLRPTPVREYIPAWRERLEGQRQAPVPTPAAPSSVGRQKSMSATEKPLQAREPAYSYTLDEPIQMPPAPAGGLGMVEKTMSHVLGDDEQEV